MYRLGMLLLIKVVRRSRKKVQFMSISCELGSMSKYSRFSLSMSSSLLICNYKLGGGVSCCELGLS